MRIFSVIVLGLALLGTGCTYYQVAPGTYPSVSKFDRAWSATQAAFIDQGVPVTREDRSAGIVRGSKDGIDVTATLRTQADGSVRVQFGTAGDVQRDPGLIQRISNAYDRHMGR